MSVTVSNCIQICNAPTNQSTSKMLYSFPRQPRFLKRKTILYFLPHPDATSTTNSKTLFPTEEPLWATVTSTTSPRNFPSLLLPTLTTSAQVPTKASASVKAETK